MEDGTPVGLVLAAPVHGKLLLLRAVWWSTLETEGS
jgi:hypothetical protein